VRRRYLAFLAAMMYVATFLQGTILLQGRAPQVCVRVREHVRLLCATANGGRG
jgi:hypothetical protein